MKSLPTFEELHLRVKQFENRSLQEKEPEDALVWEQLLQNRILDRLPAGFALYDDQFVLLRYNRIYGDYVRMYTPYDAEQALGMSHFDYKPGAKPYMEAWFRHVKHSRTVNTQYDFKLGVRINGKYRFSYWDSHLAPVMDSSGAVRGFVMCCIDATERHLAKKALESRDEVVSFVRNYEDLKSSFRFLMEIRTEDKRRMEQNMLHNVNKLVTPCLAQLRKSRLSAYQMNLLSRIESNLNSIISPFSSKLSSKYFDLSPTEIRIAGLVRDGYTSKEIAELLGVTKDCIDFHRNNIRKKLGITNKKANLETRLTLLSQDN
jgi:DNA-binding CsgD family transcriptional regulator